MLRLLCNKRRSTRAVKTENQGLAVPIVKRVWQEEEEARNTSLRVAFKDALKRCTSRGTSRRHSDPSAETDTQTDTVSTPHPSSPARHVEELCDNISIISIDREDAARAHKTASGYMQCANIPKVTVIETQCPEDSLPHIPTLKEKLKMNRKMEKEQKKRDKKVAKDEMKNQIELEKRIAKIEKERNKVKKLQEKEAAKVEKERVLAQERRVKFEEWIEKEFAKAESEIRGESVEALKSKKKDEERRQHREWRISKEKARIENLRAVIQKLEEKRKRKQTKLSGLVEYRDSGILEKLNILEAFEVGFAIGNLQRNLWRIDGKIIKLQNEVKARECRIEKLKCNPTV